jgi:hypothetical protein
MSTGNELEELRLSFCLLNLRMKAKYISVQTGKPYDDTDSKNIYV